MNKKRNILKAQTMATVMIWGHVETEMFVSSQLGWRCEQWVFKLGWRQGAGMVRRRGSW